MSTTQDVHRMIKELKQDEEHYAQRKVILSSYQNLLVIGQFHAVITPVLFEKNGVHLSLILPRQSMMLCTNRSERPAASSIKKAGACSDHGHLK